MIDALAAQDDELSPLELSYALKAHFDFVVEHKTDGVMFAVEYDGSQHYTDEATRRRDKLKNTICERLNLPLLRIDAGYLRKIGNYYTSLLSWWVEMFFLEREFSAAQNRGDIPVDEVWSYGSYMSSGIIKDGKLVPLDIEIMSFEQIRNYIPILIAQSPYDPFRPSRVKLLELFNKKLVNYSLPEILQGQDENDYLTFYALVELPDTRTVVGKSRCKVINFAPISTSELAHELAVVDLVNKLEDYLQGTYWAIGLEQVKALRKIRKHHTSSIFISEAEYGK